nr:rho guanine nucleotide exchange factor 26-like isoform X2 [Lepeophtheirus salmonis]
MLFFSPFTLERVLQTSIDDFSLIKNQIDIEDLKYGDVLFRMKNCLSMDDKIQNIEAEYEIQELNIWISDIVDTYEACPSSKSQHKQKRKPTLYFAILSSENKTNVSCKNNKSTITNNIVRPKEAPPDPPIFDKDSINLNIRNDIITDKFLDKTNINLFCTEPLYHQFYCHENNEMQSDKYSTRSLICCSFRRFQKRTLWSELSEVKNHLLNLTENEVKLQEALFEVITSEASYLKSLNILISHFISSTKLVGNFVDDSSSSIQEGILSKRECHILFSDIIYIRDVSKKFFIELENQWQKSIFLENILPIIEIFGAGDFKHYVKYTANQIYQDRLLSQKLLSSNDEFKNIMKELESDPICESLSLHSFLILPLQRITRYPLLVSAILKYLPLLDEPRVDTCKSALKLLNNLVNDCNESARHMDRMEEMLILSRQFDFMSEGSIPLLSPNRWLIRKTRVAGLMYNNTTSELKKKFSCRLKVNKQHLNLCLFTDLLVIVKQKSEDHYKVLDHCPRNLAHISDVSLNEENNYPDKFTPDLNKVDLHCLSWLTILHKHADKTLEFLITFDSESEKSCWNKLLYHECLDNFTENIYESWHCPVIQTLTDYGQGSFFFRKGTHADVLRKETEWLFVKSIIDKKAGWIPISLTEEVDSNHIKAKNLRQRHRLFKLVSNNFSLSY